MKPSGLNALVIAPMGKHPSHEEPDSDEPKDGDEPDGDEDGLKETFDEYAKAMDDGDHDAAYEAFKSFVEQCCSREYSK